MKKTLLLIILLLLLATLSADIYEAAADKPEFTVKTLELRKSADESYVWVYIKIPVVSVELKKETTREGQMLYKSKVKFNITASVDGKEVGKDSWKSTNLVAENLNSRLYIFDYTIIEAPSGKDISIDVQVEDLYAKKQNTLHIAKSLSEFKDLSMSQLVWATQIRDLKPEDRSNTRFISLYLNPIIDNVFFSPGYPLAYFEVYGLVPDEDDEYNYKITYSIFDNADKLFYTFIDTKEGEFLESGDIIVITSPVILDILALVSSGDYTISIEVEDLNNGAKKELREKLTKKL